MKMISLFSVLTLLATCLLLTSCSIKTTSTHTVKSELDRFSEEMNGRKVEFENWTLTIDGKSIPIEKKESVIRVEQGGGKVDVFVNDVQVHDE
ncbi:MAG: hypothetical protein AAGA58_03660 [Verrucomicrobiota bacterium]